MYSVFFGILQPANSTPIPQHKRKHTASHAAVDIILVLSLMLDP
jgi:hypothetical protein